MKKIFIVAPYFPPSAMPPSQRVRLIVQHATSLGFYPTIFTVKPKYREEAEDPWMLELAGTDYNLIYVDCLDQKKTRKLKVGDLGLRMLPYLFSSLKKHAKKEKPDFILYPVPPWYILSIAPAIKKLTKINYGIDFIDPWVYDLDPAERSFKRRASQWIARRLEKRACINASVIYSVSQGINDSLIKRYPELINKLLIAVPYGAEKNDFDIIRNQTIKSQREKTIVRYIGALWLDCYPVLDGLMPALAEVRKEENLQIEFYGTSYAAQSLAKPQLNKWIDENKMNDYVVENPYRVTYKKAVELTLGADVLLLIGGMQPYYAASKLMGLLVSGKPFIAFLHKDSFPAKLLTEVDYRYLVTYSNDEEEMPSKRINAIIEKIKMLIENKDSFSRVDLTHPLIEQNTAYGMAKTFLDPINKLIA